MTARSGSDSLYSMRTGIDGRHCIDCRDRMIEMNPDTDGRWWPIDEITPAEVVAGLDHCDACGTTVALAVRS